jgi:hypothetical protein
MSLVDSIAGELGVPLPIKFQDEFWQGVNFNFVASVGRGIIYGGIGVNFPISAT